MKMNIWAYEKDISIKHLLLLLQIEFTGIPYHIQEARITTNRSVRLCNPNDNEHSIYIYTYGQEQGRYGVHLEYANQRNRTISDIIEVFDNLTYEQLVDLIKVQFS